ncbi:HTH-type transcriptional repressor NsrR-like [Teleopsis dalmanni]|uniref:HTH-type transcriptional repressor NsrR-like n=1 Tax=Teleopsis dalmanni TaxID=139649 RepID=UPI0018CDA24E|nr:HTH-type transcriptional repressor NsrR-like [Teleopsis dalmanni]
MQLSNFTDYGIRVLIYLANIEQGTLSNITTVSQHYQISRNHLVKIVHRLGQLGYIDTVQGKNGGIRLKLLPKHINIGKVIRELEPLELLNCSPDACIISPACRLKGYLVKAKEAFLQELENYTLFDLVNDNPPLRNLLE